MTKLYLNVDEYDVVERNGQYVIVEKRREEKEMINRESKHVRIDDYHGTWSVISTGKIKGNVYYLMRADSDPSGNLPDLIVDPTGYVKTVSVGRDSIREYLEKLKESPFNGYTLTMIF